MLGFINTSILIGLISVSIPLLIHLLARQKVKRIYFSSLVFLKKIQKQHFKRMQIRQILLLILRCLAILFIVLAFARPAFKAGNLFHGKSKASVIIAMDHSISMARGDVWAQVQSAATQVTGILNASDQVALLGNSQTAPSLMESQIRSIDKKIQQATPQYVSPSMENILKMGADILSSSEINREIYCITDLQQTSFSTDADSMFHLDNMDHCYIIPIHEDVPNTALVDGGVENQIISSGEALRVFAQVTNFSDQPADAILVRLSLNQTSVAQKVVAVPAQSSRRVMFSVTPRESGWTTGEIELEEDGFSMDNRWHFSLYIPSKIRVLVLGNQPIDILPIRLALTPKSRSTNFEIRESLFSQDWSQNLDQVDVAYMNGCPPFTEFEIQALKQFVNRGGGLILIPGSETNLRQLNEQLLSASHLTLGNLNRSENLESHRSFGRIDFSHPLFEQIFKKSHEQLRSPEFYRSIDVVNPGESQVLIRYKDGSPFLLTLHEERGNLLMLTSGIAPPWSDFQTTPFFAPLIHRMALFAAHTNGHDESLLCGQTIQIPLKTIPNYQSQYLVQLPSGEERDVLPEMVGSQLQLIFKSTNTPGIYRFFQEDSLLAVKAVNMDPAESDFKFLEPDQFKKRFSNIPISIISENESLTRTVQRARWGREIGWEMLLIALALLLMEMGLAKGFKAEGKRL